MAQNGANVALYYDPSGHAGLLSAAAAAAANTSPPSASSAAAAAHMAAASGLQSVAAAAAAAAASVHGGGMYGSVSSGVSTSGLGNGLLGVGAGEHFCLRWNDYEKKYAETFRILRDDEYFTDVTLATEENHSVKAHRVILSACSNYFHAILKTMSPWERPVLLLDNVRAADLDSLMDFIYFGQVSVPQDALQSFLKLAEKLKIKGLCEAAVPPPPAPTVMQRKDLVPTQAMATSVSASGFETLLPRSPYIPLVEQASAAAAMPMSAASPTPQRMGGHLSPPPAAHQSPRHVAAARVPVVMRQPHANPMANPEAGVLHFVPPPVKRAKTYAMQPQSILRNQLQIKEAAEHQQHVVEVKSEPMGMLSAQGGAPAPGPEDMPSSGVNVGEFMASHDTDLALPSLAHGISPQFIFSPDPGADQGQNAAAAAVDHAHMHHHHHSHLRQHHLDEPQDLTPAPVDASSPASSSAVAASVSGTAGTTPSTPTSAASSLVGSPSTPTPTPKKDRNTRKTCNFCHKDFHEMSLKRHIKDVHFRSQNTNVTCPHCMKQYASQNSLYSHLNRVHGVKKELLADLDGAMGQAGQSGHLGQMHGTGADDDDGAGDSNHDGIMDLAQHSDSSN